MKTVCTKDNCTGCMACVESCPKNAIKIVDELDSYNAIINEEQCVNCDLCRKVCQNNRNVKFTQPIMWKQGWARDTLVRSSSSSGGVAQAIERAFVRTGGIVCSCAFEKGTFGFMFAESEKEVEKFKGSKYVKSNPSGIYKKIKEYLIAGRKVLFVGLPCQVEAVKCYVGEKLDNSLYAKRKNLLMGSNPIIAPDSEMLWNAAIVWRILRRYEYTGALVMGRRKKIDVNTTSVRTLPEDKWIIAENAHAAIVTRDEYYQAQKAIRNVTPIQYKVGDDFALKGKICCGNCNRQLRHERQYGEMVFYCGYKRSAGKFSKCYGGYYREHSVNAKVARAIKTVFYALDVVNQGMQEKQSITVRCVDIENLEKQAEAIRVEQIKLYESYADGVLLRDAYIEKKKALSEKLAVLQDSIRTEKEEQECADELDEEIRALTKQASEKTYIGGLTKECVDAFVSMVYLYDDQTMKIEFNCEDVIRRALEKYGA